MSENEKRKIDELNEGERIMKWGAVFFALVALAAGGWYFLQTSKVNLSPEESGSEIFDDAIVAVILPDSLGEKEQFGEAAYVKFCSECHGANGQGRKDIAPPLVHKIYEPNHHGDMAFALAAKNGVRAHHWNFGNMPAVEGIAQTEILNVVTYVRALQRKNGIE
ncbi:c-type cytochrome [Sulfitobacter sp. CW3]|uniref:c-type cytochrome n=1 Tax=Sulfitobacter sp. CW3 TaxID=2861965 RepID=UPI0021508BB6|nr:cytochrome c [Sulfitobacter sp. CW3]|tara:strand:- start:12 stop:503 length:492 start_codon:yes stop_codon:yes gene_type:complete